MQMPWKYVQVENLKLGIIISVCQIFVHHGTVCEYDPSPKVHIVVGAALVLKLRELYQQSSLF